MAPKKRPAVDVSDISTEVASNTKNDSKLIKKKRKPSTRTPSSYVMFSMEHRKLVSQEFPELSLGEVSKRCGEAWSQLPEDLKSEWKAKADALKLEKQTSVAESGVVETKVKRKPSSYLRFSMEYRKEIVASNSKLSLGEVSKMCGEAWKKLSDEDKEIWKKKAAEE